MIVSDYHVHSHFSPDSSADMHQMCQAALQKGLTHICFTDHVDIGHCLEVYKNLPSMEKYHAQHQQIQKAFPGLCVGLGLECGYLPETIAQSKAFLQSAQPLDCILWSVHQVGTEDAYLPAYFEGKTRAQAYEAYLQAVLQSLTAWDGYHVVGHIGYVWKNAQFENPVLEYQEFPMLLDEILRTVIRLDKAIEINSSGFRRHNSCIPPASIVARYYQLGGRLLTFGSDAHAPQYVGLAFDKAYSMVKAIGFTEYFVFQKGQPKSLPL